MLELNTITFFKYFTKDEVLMCKSKISVKIMWCKFWKNRCLLHLSIRLNIDEVWLLCNYTLTTQTAGWGPRRIPHESIGPCYFFTVVRRREHWGETGGEKCNPANFKDTAQQYQNLEIRVGSIFREKLNLHLSPSGSAEVWKSYAEKIWMTWIKQRIS